MKKVFSVALAAICTTVLTAMYTPLSASTPFALAKKGAEAEYSIKDAKGNVISYSKIVVKEVNMVDDRNFSATCTTEAFDGNYMPLTAPVTTTIEVKDGAVATAPNTFGMEGVEIEGTLPTYPADISVGQTMEYSFTMKMMGMEIVTTGRDTVVARESVTTPAGEFDCLRIESDVTVNAVVQNTKMKTVTWISAGVGNVKMETYTDRNKLQMTQELTSLKR